MAVVDLGEGNLAPDLARLFEKERMGLLLLLEETDPHLINSRATPFPLT